jgi:hypothetical protein
MQIEHYSFGKIIIEGRTYTSDVIIYPGRVDSSWWRKEGHYLQATDLSAIVEAKPHILIIGTGFWGVMKVPQETVDFLSSKGVETRIEKTGKAIELFNAMGQDTSVIAALHLTC